MLMLLEFFNICLSVGLVYISKVSTIVASKGQRVKIIPRKAITRGQIFVVIFHQITCFACILRTLRVRKLKKIYRHLVLIMNSSHTDIEYGAIGSWLIHKLFNKSQFSVIQTKDL